ncbi:MAG: DnaD domain protein [Eubacterium sp.]|nr:DnaD domain protein [Eubacterium sp.]
MEYKIMPFGEIWNGGAFCVPKELCEKRLNFADDKQLRVLLLVLNNSGVANTEELKKALKLSDDEVNECLEYWVSEGVMITDTAESKPPVQIPEEQKKTLEALPVPTLTPKDIVAMCAENGELADLLRTAEGIMGSSLSNSMKSNLINMVTYYGLPVPVVVTLLEYYKTQRENGKNITTRTLQNLAKDWAADEVNTLDKAGKKLRELENCEELWSEVIALCEFDYKKPTSAQLKMLSRWSAAFSKDMIFFACNTMKKYNDEDKRSIKIVDNILKEWKRKGFKTPDEVKAPRDSKKKSPDKLKGKPSFDINELYNKAIHNDEYDV